MKLNTKRQRAKAQALHEKAVNKKLTNLGWKQTSKGWRRGNEASVPATEALATVNAEKRAAKEEFNREAEEYILKNGWEKEEVQNIKGRKFVGRDPETGRALFVPVFETRPVYKREHWERPVLEGESGYYYANLHKAYAQQLKIDGLSGD